jgi:hypothetical protein
MSEKAPLTANEIIEGFNIAKSTFYTKVKELGIEGELPPGRQRGNRYAFKDVEKILESLGKSQSKPLTRKSQKHTIFRRARPEDAQQMHELGERIMRESGEHSVPAKMLLQFLSLPGSEIGHVLLRNEHIIGYFTLVPLTHQSLMNVMRRDEQSLFNQLRTRSLQLEDLAQFEPGKPVDLFVWEVISDPKQKTIGQYLIGYMLNLLHTLGKRGVDIKGVYAVATTPEGINICRRMGMQIMDLPELIQPDWVPFEWKIQEKKTWLTRNYIQALKSYKKRQQRMIGEADSPASASDDF